MIKKIKIEDFCLRCGKPEKSRYKPGPNTNFICSMCVQDMCGRRANAEKEAAEKEKVMKKRMKRAKRFEKSV